MTESWSTYVDNRTLVRAVLLDFTAAVKSLTVTTGSSKPGSYYGNLSHTQHDAVKPVRPSQPPSTLTLHERGSFPSEDVIISQV